MRAHSPNNPRAHHVLACGSTALRFLSGRLTKLAALTNLSGTNLDAEDARRVSGMDATNQTGKSLILTKSHYSPTQKGNLGMAVGWAEWNEAQQSFAWNSKRWASQAQHQPTGRLSIMPLCEAEHRRAGRISLTAVWPKGVSVMPDQIEKHREPAGQAWAALLFGSFILGTQNKWTPSGSDGIQRWSLLLGFIPQPNLRRVLISPSSSACVE